jgi:hypothetical protein
LRRLGHHICLVQNDELEALCKDTSGFGKAFDLITNNINTSIVGGIQLANGELPCHVIVNGTYLQNLLLITVTVQSPSHRDDSTCLSSSRRAIEEKMRQSILLNELFN